MAPSEPGSGLKDRVNAIPHPPDHRIQPLPRQQIGEDERPVATHLAGVAVHHVEVGADVRGEVDLVDEQQVRAGNDGAAFAGDFVAGGNVDDVDGEVGQLRAEGGGQVVAAAFDEDELQVGEAIRQAG